MPIKGVLFILIIIALAICISTPIKRGCAPTGFKKFEPLVTFTEARYWLALDVCFVQPEATQET